MKIVKWFSSEASAYRARIRAQKRKIRKLEREYREMVPKVGAETERELRETFQ